MTKIEVESLSTAVNAAVIRLPGRKSPAIVIQGDSLKILVDLASEIGRLSDGSDNLALQDTIAELRQTLGCYISVYEETLRENGEPLPYQ
jgi:hypothetical protein